MSSSLVLRRLRARFSHNQATGTVVADPRRPSLFYHLVEPPTPLAPASDVFALSFLSQPPPNAEASAIIGWIPAPFGASSLSPEQLLQRLSWREFRENGECSRSTLSTTGLTPFVAALASFKQVLHKSIYASLRDQKDEFWLSSAKQLQEGWMHIHGESVLAASELGAQPPSTSDQRNPPALGRIGDPDDIIASVLVEKGVVRPETYQPMPSYRVCTADGVLQLTPQLLQDLVEALQRVTEGEQASVNP